MYRLVLLGRSPAVQSIRITLGTNHCYASSIDLLTRSTFPLPPSLERNVNARVYTQLLQQTCPTSNAVLNKTAKLKPKICAVVTKREQSTTITKTEKKSKRRSKTRKPRYYKFVELLEVTNSKASERKSRVKRLRAKKLQEFIAKTQLQILEKRAKQEQKANRQAGKLATAATTAIIKQQPVEYQKIDIEALNNSLLDTDTNMYDDKPLIFFGKQQYTRRVVNNPEEIQNILKSFHNFRDIIETVGEEAQMEAEYSVTTDKLSLPEELTDSLDIAVPYINVEKEVSAKKNSVTSVENKVLAGKAKPRFKTKIHHNIEQERQAKERSLRITLNTYLNVCVSNGMMSRALCTVLSYRQRSKMHSNKSNLFTVEMYNTLLHGFAEKGSFERFKDVFALMQEDGLAFNEQTFAAIFECLGRVETTEENKRLIVKYIKKAEQMGLTLNQIMDRSKFVADQRDIALDAIQRIRPQFTPIYTPPELGYANVLLNHLNTEVQAIGSTHASQSNGKIMQSKNGFTKEQLEEKAREQLKIELNGCITISSIEKSKEFPNAEYCREKLAETEQRWRTQIMTAINRDLNTLRAQMRFKPQGYMSYYTYLKTLDASTYADILIKEAYKLAEGSETYSPSVMQLFKELGQKVQQKFHIEQKKQNGILEKVGDIYSAYCEKWQCTQESDNTRQMWQRLVHEQRATGPSMDINEAVWPNNVLTGVGRFLYNILMRDIKIDTHIMRQKSKSKTPNLLPAFYTLFRNHSRLVTEEVKPHPVLARLLRASKQQTLTFDSNLVPMLCPPQPWSTPYNGGYLLNKSELIRLPHQAIQQWERINSSNPQCMYPSLDSLNQLASIPWRVNTDILDIIIEVFQKGGDHKLDVPQAPSTLPPLPTLSESDANVTSAERAKLFKEKMIRRRKQAEMYSLWCDTLYRLSLANHYRDKVFWLPHNMDFRGRVYPIPPHLNHLGSDLARSMLIFDQAQPLGVDGFSWLKLHCINLTGLKKRESVRERLLFAEVIMDEILDSADRPLTGRMWWTQSDEPWQTLACCMEIAKVKRSANPEAYLSRFPIHQDGSCNGLQHYAALGRDKAGAISVNLAPSNKPQDVYSAVAALVEKSRAADAENGLHVAQALSGFVRRKVIKQTVMTTVYGVTRYGARLQIARQLKDIDDFPKDWVWPASTYLTTKTFESLREMFTSTREIQDWFTECARQIAGVCGQNVEWVTPLGLPVVQPYNRQEIPRAKMMRNGVRVNENMPLDMFERPNVMKQKNAFPPNFIHSLDSSHMMLTSLHCERAGLTFVSVHDCFWTHACTVPDLNKICREQFVSLHLQPILEDLSQFMCKTYNFQSSDSRHDGTVDEHAKVNLNRVLRQLPQKGDFDLHNVLDSVYFFS